MGQEIINILLIEDNPADARMIRELLSETDGFHFSLLNLELIRQLTASVLQTQFNVILLDMGLPDATGVQAIEKVNQLTNTIPIVVLTGNLDEALALQALQRGAQDYLIKDQVTGPLLVRAIRYAIERKKLEERLLILATRDMLTGLANRRLFYDHLEKALKRLQRKNFHSERAIMLAILIIDLDKFKGVNDRYGHLAGDKCLVTISNRLVNCVRKSDTVARFGGDEFAILLENIENKTDVENIAKKIVAAVNQPIRYKQYEYAIGASVGISMYTDRTNDIDSLIQSADRAMYRVKNEGQGYYFYN